jgi:hypothetical protein
MRSALRYSLGMPSLLAHVTILMTSPSLDSLQMTHWSVLEPESLSGLAVNHDCRFAWGSPVNGAKTMSTELSAIASTS